MARQERVRKVPEGMVTILALVPKEVHGRVRREGFDHQTPVSETVTWLLRLAFEAMDKEAKEGKGATP